MVDIENFSSTSFENFDINLVQKEVDGGSVSVDQIAEAIGNTPNARSIVISGLKQDTFDCFITRYGKQFEALQFLEEKAKKKERFSKKLILDVQKYVEKGHLRKKLD